MAKVVINFRGIKTYRDNKGRLHREDGPAVIYPDGSKFYHVNGSRTSITQPTSYFDNGYVEWNLYAIPHRDNGPACASPNGLLRWVDDGERIWPKL